VTTVCAHPPSYAVAAAALFLSACTSIPLTPRYTVTLHTETNGVNAEMNYAGRWLHAGGGGYTSYVGESGPFPATVTVAWTYGSGWNKKETNEHFRAVVPIRSVVPRTFAKGDEITVNVWANGTATVDFEVKNAEGARTSVSHAALSVERLPETSGAHTFWRWTDPLPADLQTKVPPKNRTLEAAKAFFGTCKHRRPLNEVVQYFGPPDGFSRQGWFNKDMATVEARNGGVGGTLRFLLAENGDLRMDSPDMKAVSGALYYAPNLKTRIELFYFEPTKESLPGTCATVEAGGGPPSKSAAQPGGPADRLASLRSARGR
jgi:hypothetical protein